MTRASCILFWFSMTLVVSLGLYHTSYRVDGLTHKLRRLNAQIEAEQRNIHVLKAEWVFLANPARIEDAARKHLALEPTKTNQIASLNKLSKMLPTRSESSRNKAIASLRPRPAAHAPQALAEESDRLNTRLVIGKSASADLPQKTSFRMAGDDSYGIGTYGGAP
jgi:cell division protein FtsL